MGHPIEEARRYIPGGVNSPVRAYKSVGGDPVFARSGSGSRLLGEDGREYIDYVMSYGPLILGHAPPVVTAAINKAASKGTSFGAPTVAEVEIAKLLCSAVPGVEKVRLVNSGTEATMSAIRVARAFTGRDLIVKMNGCYHGHGDAFLVKAGSGALTLGVPDSPGVPADFSKKTLIAEYNDLASVRALFEAHEDEIAAVIVEPVAGNMGCVPPRAGYLAGLKDLCGKGGALLIFDEVMTGFRVGPGGASGLFGVTADLVTLGKVIGGGLPVGAYGGRSAIMDLVAPAGPVYQAGTLSGNPLAVAAGLAMLKEVLKPGFFDRLERLSKRLGDGIAAIAERGKHPCRVNRVGSMLTVFLTNRPVTDFPTALSSDRERFKRFFLGLLAGGVLIPPSQFEAWFVSTAHTNADIDRTLAAVESALAHAFKD